jgi:hypothetical protein
MNKGILLAGGLGAGLIALAVHQRRQVARGAEVVSRAAEKIARPAVDLAQALIDKAKLPIVAFQNIKRYGIWQLVDNYKGDVPWILAMAIIHTETGGTFDPTIYNYYYKGPDGKDKLGVDYARDGKFTHKPWAIGLFQILEKWRSLQKGTYAGVSLPTVESLLNPELNIKAGMANLNIQLKRVERLAPGISDVEKWKLVYFGHNQGGGALEKGLKAAKDKTNAGEVVLAAGKTNYELSVAEKTATRVAVWDSIRAIKDQPA